MVGVTLFLGALSPRAVAQFSAVAVSPDGKIVAAGGEKGQICLWDVKSGSLLHEMTAAKPVRGLAFVRDEKILAAGTNQGGVEIWVSKPAGYARAEHFCGNQLIYAVAASADGKTLAVSGHSGWTSLHETTAWKPVGVIFERSNFTCGVAFARDGSFLATAGNTFSLWNTDSASALWKPRGERPIDDLEAATKKSLRWAHSSNGDINDDVYCADIAVSPDGRRVVGVNGVGRHNSGGKTLTVWNAQTGKKSWASRSTRMTCVVFTADGKRIATGSHDGTVRVWDPESGELLHEVKEHTKAVRNLAAMPEGTGFVSAAEDGTAALWDGQTGKRVREFRNRD
jgi:WD40 repeat protein